MRRVTPSLIAAIGTVLVVVVFVSPLAAPAADLNPGDVLVLTGPSTDPFTLAFRTALLIKINPETGAHKPKRRDILLSDILPTGKTALSSDALPLPSHHM